MAAPAFSAVGLILLNRWLEQKTALKQGQLQEWTEHSHTAQDL